MSSDSNPLVAGGDLLKIFDIVTGPGQGGVVRAEIGAGGREDGSIVENNATILLPSVSLTGPSVPDDRDRFGRDFQLWADSDAILHEVIHAAGLRSYSDEELSKAVSQMVDTPPLPVLPALTVNSTDQERSHYAFTFSAYWNNVLREHCKHAPRPNLRPGFHWGNNP